jgi:hypothetical protein
MSEETTGGCGKLHEELGQLQSQASTLNVAKSMRKNRIHSTCGKKINVHKLQSESLNVRGHLG